MLISGPDDPLVEGPTVRREDLEGYRIIVSQRGSLLRALVDEVLAGGSTITIVAEVAHRTSILPMVVNGLGRAVMPSAWTESARRAGAHVQRIVPESYLHVAAVSRRSHLTASAAALMDHARAYAARAVIE